MRNVAIAVLFSISVVFGQTISLSGKVTNSAGTAIEGAVVKLFVNAKACTTKVDGMYSFSGQVGTIMNSSQIHAHSITYKNEMFIFNVAEAVPASVKLYDLRGRMVAHVFSGMLAQGVTAVPFAKEGLGQAMFIVRVTMGGKDATYTFVPANAKTFTLSAPSFTIGKLAKTVAADWLQASKTGYAANIQQITVFTGTKDITLAALTAPNFGPNVKIFDPTMAASTIQSTMDGLYSSTNEFSTQRTAYLFKPGNYSLNIRVRYYIQAYGMGMSPDEVQVTGTVESTQDGTGSFWRGLEGFSVTPTGGTSVWAVSQADPFRRMHVKGQMSLCNSGASGGFISDSKIDGTINTNCGQQFYIRNSILTGVNAGGMWNLLIQGCDNPPAENFPTGGITVVAKTPLVREKPFLVFDNASGAYSVFVPALRTNSQGTTWYNATPAGERLPIDQFFVAVAGTDNATTMNAALAQGKNLLLTPGIYLINAPLLVQRPKTVVLGLGMATLQAQNGAIPLKTADVDGITIANVLIEAGTVESPVLFQVGDSGSVADHSANPPFVFDLFIRPNGSINGRCKIGAIFNSNNTILDHCWIWRGDHGTGAGWISDTNTIRHGLVINGNDCITYGQMVEHWQKYNTLWNGNNGRQYFYQHEFNYDVPNQASFMEGTVNGKPAIKVANGVTNYEGWGIGIYSYFRQAPVTVTNAMVVPRLPGVKVHHIVTFSLDRDQGTILHAINDTGPAAKYQVKNMIRFDEYVGH
jgi:hypothetical protein